MNRRSSYRFANGKATTNRVVVPPMASRTADENGFVTEASVAHYRELAASGAGLVFVEYSYVHPSGKGEPTQMGAQSDDKIDGLSRLATTIHDAGALAGLQIVHTGGKTSSAITGSPLLSPSGIPVPVKDRDPEVPVAMNRQQIQDWSDWFVAAAGRGVRAGFDIIELHAAHGYGLNQWLSPLTNQRTDEYGGTMENRARLLVEIVRRIRSSFPELLISVRIPGQDHLPGGLTLDDMSLTIELLEGSGVSLLNVSSGIGGWRRPENSRGEEGYLVADAATLKQRTSLPVIGVGGIESGAAIDRMLATRQLDFAAIGRAILADPRRWREINLPTQ